jgi:Bromodomain
MSPSRSRKRKARDESEEDSEEGDSFKEEESQSENESVSDANPERVSSPAKGSTRASSRISAARGQNASARTKKTPIETESSPQQRRTSTRGARISYAEKSESEFEEQSEDGLSEDEDSMTSPRKRPARSRRAAKPKAAARKPPAKKTGNKKQKSKPKKKPRKRKRGKSTLLDVDLHIIVDAIFLIEAPVADESEEESEDSEVESELSEVEEITSPRSNRARSKRMVWPEIRSEHITHVTTEMLAFLVSDTALSGSLCSRHTLTLVSLVKRNMDEDKLFELPVVETLPELKHHYLSKISRPMDFRTIEEERIQYYSSITELQDDLICIFSNCIKFNGEMSDYAQFAQ